MLDLPADTPGNPLDTLEEIVRGRDWAFERFGEAEMLVSCSGRWSDYALHFTWSDDLCTVHMSCAVETRFPDARRPAIHELLTLINGHLWLGHFDLGGDRATPVFRHAVPLRGTRGATAGQLEDLVEIAIGECERFYPAFQYVAWAGKAPREAIDASMIETAGEA